MNVLLGALMVTIVALVIGMGVFKTQGKGQVKKASGILWLPEGFLRKNSSERRRSRRRGPDGQEMRNISQLQSNVTCISSGQWSDEESDLPPAKRPRDNTVISDYDDVWNQSLHDDRPIILTPPSMVSIDEILMRRCVLWNVFVYLNRCIYLYRKPRLLIYVGRAA